MSVLFDASLGSEMMAHYKLLIVGAGPGGIAAAAEYITLGGDPKSVVIFEKGEVPIEAIRKFYPDKKMTIANYKGLPTVVEGHLETFPDLTKPETLVYFDQLIAKYGLAVKFKSEVSKIERAADGMFAVTVGHNIHHAEVVMIGIGILGRPNKPSTYKIPSSLRDHVLFDLTSQKIEGKKVLVVGGGDTSSEYCQILVSEGNNVTLAYRSATFNRMMDQNRLAVEELAQAKKMRLLRSTEIKEVIDRDVKPEVQFVDCAVENLTPFAPEVFDKVIYAIGGTTPLNFLITSGIECENNWPKVGASGETNVPGCYLVGDLAVGKQGGSIITAYNAAFRSVKHAFENVWVSRG